MVLQLIHIKDKVGVTETWQKAADEGEAGASARDAELALLALGYKQVDARKAIRAVLQATPQMPTEELIREALRGLS